MIDIPALLGFAASGGDWCLEKIFKRTLLPISSGSSTNLCAYKHTYNDN